MKIFKYISSLLLFLIILSGPFGCTTQKELTYLNNIDTAAVTQFFPMDRPNYKIQYQDILYVSFFTMNADQNVLLNPGAGSTNSSYMFRDASSTYIYGYTVDDAGLISLPIIGDVEVYGLTVEEIKRSIQRQASLYLKDPTINVRLLSFKYTVIGEVNRPGVFTNFNNQLTVLEAIGNAGDITDYGDRKKVLVVRPTKEGTYTYRINLQDKLLLQSEGYFLLPNDMVIVEPIKSKPFQLNLPTTSLIVTSAISTISTLILLLNFIKTSNS